MCGITGFWARQGAARFDHESAIRAMTGAIAHRGPDAEGFWSDPSLGLALGHRRLSIMELSAAGAQPMHSASGRWTIVFNGEIYNHLDLRSELGRGASVPQWRGHSDTETLLAGIEAWGLEQTLTKAAGMFAFALWDRQTRRLWLARDRMGEKPLYWGSVGGVFVFASELKALRAMPDFAGVIDPDAVALMLEHLCVPDPLSIYRGIHKLPPGGLLEIADGEAGDVLRWWSLDRTIKAGAAARSAGYDERSVDAFEACLTEVVRSQMLSDVPIGAFLSGGVDSALITSIMQSVAPGKVKTYSIGFGDKQFNEAPHAAAVARHLKTDHTEFIVTEADALDLAPKISSQYDEPFADASQIPTFIISQLARRSITVALTGDGGDELFGGYNGYRQPPRLWSMIDGAADWLNLPLAMSGRALAAVTARAASSESLAATGWRLHRVGHVLSQAYNRDRLYSSVNSVNPAAASLLHPDLRRQMTGRRGQAISARPDSSLSVPRWMMAQDSMALLPSDILVKVDRAAMAVSLETRAPLLDTRIVEHIWCLPDEACFGVGQSKRILRDVLARHVPKAITDRPKQGFSVPVCAWLRGPLRDWAASMISPGRIADTGLLDGRAVNALWQALQSGNDAPGNALWAVIALQSWALQQ